MLSFIGRLDPSLSKSDIETLAHMSQGRVGRAQDILSQGGGLQSLQTVTALLSTWPTWNWVSIHNTAELMGRGNEAEYKAFADMFLWVMDCFVRAKALNKPDMLPASLRTGNLLQMLDGFTLEQWVGINEQVKVHFEQIDHSALDKRQGVLGAFALFDKI
jgi:hypothetical protein